MSKFSRNITFFSRYFELDIMFKTCYQTLIEDMKQCSQDFATYMKQQLRFLLSMNVHVFIYYSVAIPTIVFGHYLTLLQ